MDKNFYQEYFFLERNHWWFKVRGDMIYNFLKKIYHNDKNLKILNIGIATGKTTEILSHFGEVTSIEYDKDCCEFVRDKLGIEVINGSINELPFEKNIFDLVCAFDVIEHVEKDQNAVNEISRVCKDNGVIFITVPAFMSLWSHHDEVNHHYRRYIMKQITELFKNIQGNIIKKSYFNSFLFFPILMFRIGSKILPQKFIRKGSGSDFNIMKVDSFINKILYKIFQLESKIINYISYPFGVSILFILKKNH